MSTDLQNLLTDDEFAKHITARGASTFLQILTEGSVEQFIKRFMGSSGQQVLLVVSPFIGDLEDYPYSISDVINKIDKNCIRFYVITREPKEEYHRQGIVALNKGRNVEIRYNPDIHAKLYVSWNRDEKESFAMFGSANLTSAGLSQNLELGMMILSRGYGRTLVRELYTWGNNLRTQSDCIKSFGTNSR